MNSNENWDLKIKDDVWKSVARFLRDDQERIRRTIRGLAINPYEGDVEKMKGEEHAWRRRVDAYRIKYEIYTQERVVYIYEVKRRASKTY